MAPGGNLDQICVNVSYKAVELLYWREFWYVFIGFASSEFALRSVNSKVAFDVPVNHYVLYR